MTLPTLMANNQKQIYLTRLKKAYSQLSNAIKMMPPTEGCPAGDYDCAGLNDAIDIDGQNFNNTSSSKTAYLFSKQVKGKYAPNISTTNKNPTSGGDWYDYNFLANDGSAWNIRNSAAGSISFTVDLDGTAGPNRLGKDRFAFIVATEYRNGIKPGTVMPYGSKIHAFWDSGTASERYYWKNFGCTKDDWESYACTGRVLEEDAINYY